MSVGPLRLGAALLLAGLLLHEGVYAFSAGGESASQSASHSYLQTAVPLLVALAVALAIASLILPLLGVRWRAGSAGAPLTLAAALLAIFAAQELSEALLLGGGTATLAASFASAWLLAPLALLLGTLASGLVEWLERTGERLIAAARPRRRRALPGPGSALSGPAPRLAAASPLAFGLARRPPPTPAATN